jgi:hypothetical protein
MNHEDKTDMVSTPRFVVNLTLSLSLSLSDLLLESINYGVHQFGHNRKMHDPNGIFHKILVEHLEGSA